jgi:hypothetical protein
VVLRNDTKFPQESCRYGFSYLSLKTDEEFSVSRVSWPVTLCKTYFSLQNLPPTDRGAGL